MYRFIFFGFLLLAGTILLAEEPETLAIGQQAPDFSLTGIDGNTYSLESFNQASVLCIVFSANHCPTAQAYEERMKELSAAYTPEEMMLVAISSNYPGAVCLEELGYSDLGDDFEEMKIRAREKGYNFPYLYDGEEQAMALAYGALATPHVFIFDLERKLSWRKTLDERWKEKPVDLTGTDLAGIKELLKNGSDKYRLINVWATWCGPCIIEFPEFVSMQRMYGQRNFEMVSLSADKPSFEEKVKVFLTEQQAAFPNYIYLGDDQQAFISAIDSRWQGNLPYTMLVAPGGEVVYRHSGIIDPLEVKQAIVKELGRYFADDR